MRLNSFKSALREYFRMLLPDGILKSQSQFSKVVPPPLLWNNFPVGAFMVKSISIGVFSIILPLFNGPMLLNCKFKSVFFGDVQHFCRIVCKRL